MSDTLDLARLEKLRREAGRGGWFARIWKHVGRSDTICIADESGQEIISWAGFDGVPGTKAEIRARAKLAAEAVNALPHLLSRVSELESAVREIIAKDREHEPDLALLRQTHETGFKGGIRWCANIARNVLGEKA